MPNNRLIAFFTRCTKATRINDTDYFSLIPDEIILEIMKYLRTKDLFTFSLSNRRHANLFNDACYWKERLSVDHGISAHRTTSMSIYKIFDCFEKLRLADLDDDQKTVAMKTLHAKNLELFKTTPQLLPISLNIFINHILPHKLYKLVFLPNDLSISIKDQRTRVESELARLREEISSVITQTFRMLDLNKNHQFTLFLVRLLFNIPRDLLLISKKFERALTSIDSIDDLYVQRVVQLKLTTLAKNIKDDHYKTLVSLCLSAAYSSDTIRSWLLNMYENNSRLFSSYGVSEVVIEDLKIQHHGNLAIRRR